MTSSFDPSEHTEFAITSTAWQADDTLALHYRLGRHDFTETYRFDLSAVAGSPRRPADDERVARSVALLHLTASMSYYKSSLARRIDVESRLTDDSVRWLLDNLVEHGLAEMRFTSGIQASERPTITTHARERGSLSPPSPACSGAVIVPIGGGKDSLVALDLVERAGRTPIMLAVTTFGDPLASLQLGADRPVVRVKRTIDPVLLSLNATGALNGHIPITAIISAVALVVASMLGVEEVVMSNERDASMPTIVVGGRPVNHQYSKSFDFERILAAVASRELGSPAIFSLLRPVSEATIFKRFVQLPGFLGQISSCNRVRTLGGGSAEGRRWCGACPKCLYSFLGFAAFAPADVVIDVFGVNLLDDDAFTNGYADILEVGAGPRPFECIGNPADARYLLDQAGRDPAWRSTAVFRRLGHALGDVQRPWIGGPNLIPESYWPVLAALEA